MLNSLRFLLNISPYSGTHFLKDRVKEKNGAIYRCTQTHLKWQPVKVGDFNHRLNYTVLGFNFNLPPFWVVELERPLVCAFIILLSILYLEKEIPHMIWFCNWAISEIV